MSNLCTEAFVASETKIAHDKAVGARPCNTEPNDLSTMHHLVYVFDVPSLQLTRLPTFDIRSTTALTREAISDLNKTVLLLLF